MDNNLSTAFPAWQGVTRTFVAADGTKVVVKAGLHYLEGNSRPYFSVTADVYGALYDRRGRRYYRRNPDCCGCCHDEVLAAVPADERSAWEAVIALHLADDRGVPMHAVANGTYHLGLTKWQAMNADYVVSHFRITPDELTLLLATMESLPAAEREAHVAALCKNLEPRWAAQAEEAKRFLGIEA